MTDHVRESVTVRIAGESHTIRSNAEPEYTTRCAEYVDRRIHEIQKQIGLVESHKLAILAALSITDELFQAQDAQDETGTRIAERINSLAARLEGPVSGG
jgi:cell division protein ZapA